MKFAVFLTLLSACAHEMPAPPTAFARQCNLPTRIYCANGVGPTQDTCVQLVKASITEINASARRTLYTYGESEGAIPVAFVPDLSDQMGAAGKGKRVLGVTLPILTPSGCLYAAVIMLDSGLLLGWDAPWAQTVTTHEMLHALGMDHTAAGIMTPDVTDRAHTQHMSEEDGERLRANYP
jgi:hypothetical protein